MQHFEILKDLTLLILFRQFIGKVWQLTRFQAQVVAWDVRFGSTEGEGASA